MLSTTRQKDALDSVSLIFVLPVNTLAFGKANHTQKNSLELTGRAIEICQ